MLTPRLSLKLGYVAKPARSFCWITLALLPPPQPLFTPATHAKYSQLWYHGLKRAERESKNKISSTVNCFFLLYQRALNYRVLVEVFSVPSWFCPFGANSLSRPVHCAPDEIDRPFERTKLFKITSVHVPVYISELTRT